MDRASLVALRGQPGYARFFLAATTARVADEMFSVGVVLLLLERTGSAALAGLTVAAITLPSVVTAPLLGAWLDLTGRRRGLMAYDQIGITVALVGIVLAAGNAPSVVVLALAFLTGLTYPVSFGGFTSLIPALVPDELLAPANALETTSFNAALVLGPALAGTLAGVFSPETALLTEAALSLVALALLLAVPGLNTAGRAARTTLPALLGVAREGLRQLIDVPALRGVTAAGSISVAGIGILPVAFPLFCVEQLGEPRNATGYLWAAFAVGSTLGALSLVSLQRRLAPDRIVFVAIAVFGGLVLLWPLAGSLAAMLALVALAGLADGPGLAATFAVRQRLVPRRLHGQVFTTAAGLKVGSFALGAAAAGPLVEAVGPSGALAACALAQLVASAVGVGLSRLPAPAASARRV
jgi:MFS family permease